MKCEHMNFDASVQVGRLSKEEGGPITGYTADIQVRCGDCGLPFRFRHNAYGSSPDMATVSVDNTEMRVPLEPAVTPRVMGRELKGDA